MAVPAWFNVDVYMANKLTQMQAANPAGNWTATSLAQAFTSAGFHGTEGAYNHFVQFGAKEDVAPNSFFNADEYYTAKAIDYYSSEKSASEVNALDVSTVKQLIKDAGLNAWTHYNNYGSKEGVNPSNSFDESNYLAAKLVALQAADAANWAGKTVDDVSAAFKAAGYSALTHFLTFKGKSAAEVAKTATFPVPETEQVTAASSTSSGQTFTLTVGEDSGAAFTGGASNDSFNAPIVQGNAESALDTLESFDVLDGGAGTDTLNATINSAAPAPVLKNIENLNLRFTANKGADLTSATGVTTLTIENSTADSGTIAGVGSIANLAVKNQLKNVDLNTSTATTLALNLDTVGNTTTPTQIVVDLGKTVASKATTLNVTANNANAEVKDTTATQIITTLTVAATGTNELKLTEAVKATAVTVTGTGSADLTGAAFTGALTKFDASANEGGVEADIQSTKAAVVTTGKGNDVIDMDTVTAGTSVDLGAGNDTLYTGADLADFDKGANGGEGIDIISITDGATLDATTSKYITNFETLDVSGGTGNYDVSLNSFATVQIDEAIAGALAGNVDFKNAADTFTLTIASKAKDINFDVVKNITVTGKDYTGTTAKGTAETFTLVANLNDGDKDNTAEGNIDAQTVTVAGVENIVINANVTTLDGGTDALEASKSTLTADIVATEAEVLTIKGDASVDLSGVTTIGVVTKVDATGSTGNVKIDFTTHAKSVAYTGSEGVDTYSAGTKGDVIYTGKGADVVTLDADAGAAGAVRDTYVLKAATDSQITDTSKDGKITLGGDTGFDEVINFDSIGDPTPVANTSDRLDLTNFGFTGSQRGVSDVSALVIATTDLTSIADLFSTPAGDRGVAYTVIGADSFVFVDANKDGNFTAADDLVVKLTGVGAVSETFINF
ncbi:MAG: hypothetical protein EOM03_11070 [Clostridia bacterium]|nr:hypothetical protein [Clostridia bacterium]